MTAPLALTAYPLSRTYRAELEALLAVEPTYLSLPQLRRLALRDFLGTLNRFHSRRCLLPIEDDASVAIVPILHAVSILARPRSVDVVWPDLTTSRLPTRHLPRAVAALIRASADGQLAAMRARRELAVLAGASPIELALEPTRRVLYVNPNLWFGLKVGGSVGHIAGVMNGFATAGYDVEAFSAMEPVLVSPSVVFERLSPPDSFGLPLELNFQRFQRLLVDEVVRRSRPPYAFLYQRNSVASYAGAILSHRLGTPLVLEYNGSEVWAARHWGRALRYEQLARDAEEVSLMHAAVVVTVSNVLREELLGRGVPSRRIVTHANAVDPDRYDPDRFSADERRALRGRHNIDGDAVVATFIGTFGHWHGADLLARAIARLIDREEQWVRDHRLQFLLVGDGLRMEEVRATLAADRYRPFVKLTGLVPQEQGPIYLAASDILVSPHLPNSDGTPFFGSPTKLFEYMAMGKGIVASDLDQIGEVLQPALSVRSLPDSEPTADEAALAVLARPGNEDEFLNGLRFLVERPSWRELLGRNARARALAGHTWRHHVEAILERVEGLASPPPQAAA